MRLTLLALTCGLLLLCFQQGWLPNAVASWHRGPSGSGASAEATTLEERVISAVLNARQRQGMPPVKADTELDSWLVDHIKPVPVDVETLAQGARQDWPQYEEMIVFSAQSATATGLIEQVVNWPDLAARGVTHVAAMTEPALFGLGWRATVILGQRLPTFSPEALSDASQSKFYTVCTLCQKGQACQIPRHTRTLSLECPNCHRVYAMVAADSHGRFRYANEYLTGYAPPAHFPKGQSKLAELMTIWRTVASGCRYTADAGDDDNDAWQTAQETQALGTGDCEDSAILLADWLIARSFQARVALGRYAERGGHAWVVVRLDGKDYLLESTEGASHAQRPPLLEEVGSRYVPELLFDPQAFYTSKQDAGAWKGDYWDDNAWQRVVPRPRPPASQSMITLARP